MLLPHPSQDGVRECVRVSRPLVVWSKSVREEDVSRHASLSQKETIVSIDASITAIIAITNTHTPFGTGPVSTLLPSGMYFLSVL